MLALFGAAPPPKQPKPSHVSPSAYMQVLTLPDFFTDNDTTPAPVVLCPLRHDRSVRHRQRRRQRR